MFGLPLLTYLVKSRNYNEPYFSYDVEINEEQYGDNELYDKILSKIYEVAKSGAYSKMQEQLDAI